jgi:RND family efflux transporter MFP subunit
MIRPTRLSATLGVAVLLALTGCSSKPAQVAAEPTAVQTVDAWAGLALPPINTTGLVMARDEMRLSFKVGGVIAQVTARVGDRVRQGQLLARIDMTEADAALEQATRADEKARRDLARGERLQADEVIALEQLQNLRTAASMAAAQLRAARFNHDRATITAPRDAVVLRRLAEPQELVPAGQPVLVLGAQDSGYVVRAGLSDRELVQVQPGDSVAVHLDAYAGTALSARVTRIGAAADERSGLFEIEAQLQSPPPGVAAGMVARLSITPRGAAAAPLVWVPVAAVLEGNGNKASVFVIKDHKAQRRAVQVAFITADGVALHDGVSAGESVAAAGAAYLKDGDTVQLP